MRRGNIIRFTHLFQHILEGGCPTITVSPSSIADLTVGQATTINLSSTGGTAPYTYTVTSGSLPTGLTLNGGTGVISGTPTTEGAASFQITSTDANSCTGIKSYSFNVNYEADAQAFITAASITDTTQKNAINKLVVDLKGYGIWSKMKAIYPFVGGTASAHKFNLKDPRDLDAAFRLVFSGGWTHSSTGAQPNGTNGYADTKLIPSIDLTLNNTSTSIYSRTNNSGNFCDIGSENSSTQRLLMLTKWSNLDGFHDFYDASNGRLTFTMSLTNSTGLFLANRTANNLMNLWRNSSKLSTKTSLITSTLPTRSIYLSAQNSATITSYSTRELAFATIGNGLTDTEASNLYTAVQTYQTALNRQV